LTCLGSRNENKVTRPRISRSGVQFPGGPRRPAPVAYIGFKFDRPLRPLRSRRPHRPLEPPRAQSRSRSPGSPLVDRLVRLSSLVRPSYRPVYHINEPRYRSSDNETSMRPLCAGTRARVGVHTLPVIYSRVAIRTALMIAGTPIYFHPRSRYGLRGARATSLGPSSLLRSSTTLTPSDSFHLLFASFSTPQTVSQDSLISSLISSISVRLPV
jgi:hypothetical protein